MVLRDTIAISPPRPFLGGLDHLPREAVTIPRDELGGIH